MSSRAPWLALAAIAAALAGCAARGDAGRARAPMTAAGGPSVRMAKDRPPLALVVREGDARPAIAVAVWTAGVGGERGPEVAAALAGMVEARLASKGVRDATVITGWDGYRVRVLLPADAHASGAVVTSLRASLLEPIAPSEEAALAASKRKLEALARRPLADPALLDVARCTGEAFGRPAGAASSQIGAAEIEAWRRAAHGTGRVAFGVAGPAPVAEEVAAAIGRAEVWPAAEVSATPAALSTAATTYEVPSGGAVVSLAAHVGAPARAVTVAHALADARGPLASRLVALDAPARVRDVTATVRPGEGCVAVTLELSAKDLAEGASSRIATAAALAREEIVVELDEASPDAGAGVVLALGAGDPREAAERAAWWTISTSVPGAAGAPRVSTAVGLPPSGEATFDARARQVKDDFDRALVAWHAPVVEAVSRVERGQGETWLALASPCGTQAEVDGDAGLGAAVAWAASRQAERSAASGLAIAEVEPLVAGDALGVIVHGPAAPGESSAAQARRLADLAARAFAAEPLDPALVADARGALLARASDRGPRMLSELARAVAPGHAGWLAPLGTVSGLESASDAAIVARASALRSGPLRVAVLANADEAQSAAAVRGIDRWIARRPNESRACPARATPPPPKAGTYAIETTAGTDSEAWLAFPIGASDAAPRGAGAWIAAALDGDDGLLARALRDKARAWGARVLSGGGASALVVRVQADDAELDAAVAAARAVLGALARGGLVDSDRSRAAALLDAQALSAGLDPRARLLALLRGEGGAPPNASLDALRAFCAAELHDDALVVVAARPPRAGASARR